MQHCTFCGTTAPQKSQTCARCGRDLRTTPFMLSSREETANSARPPSWGDAPTQSSPGMSQQSRQFRPVHHAYSPPQQPGPQRATQETLPQPEARRKGIAPKWLLGMVAVLLVIAGSAGGYVLLAHSRSSAPLTSNAATSTAAGSHAQTQIVLTGSTPGTSSGRAYSLQASSLPTCTGGGSHTGNFTFGGAAVGTLSLASFEACYSAPVACYSACWNATAESAGHTYFGRAQGKINGATYTFEFLISPYAGPGTYISIRSTNVVLMQNKNEWSSYGTQTDHTSITVNHDGKTGSIHTTISLITPLYDPTNTVTVIGSWSN